MDVVKGVGYIRLSVYIVCAGYLAVRKTRAYRFKTVRFANNLGEPHGLEKPKRHSYSEIRRGRLLTAA